MKKIIKILCIFLVFFSLNLSKTNAQDYDMCEPDITNFTSSVIGGLYKPHRTDTANGVALPIDASFNIIIVFVAFADDNLNMSDWPAGGAPTYMNNLLAPSRLNNGNFWERYNDQNAFLSDYYQELSLGKLHVTGVAKYVKLSKKQSEYSGPAEFNEEIYKKLWSQMAGNFSAFDKWEYLSNGVSAYQPDGFLDMLVMARKMYSGYSGFAGLDGNSILIDTANNITVYASGGPWMYPDGSGCTVQGTSVGTLWHSRFLGLAIHEVGHYLWGSHSSTGIMTSRGGNSQNDFFGSPFEKIQLGYLNPTVVNFSNVNYTIGDISNRSSNNQVLKVPGMQDNYFLITNRRRVSKYDIPILGDTINTDVFKNVGDLGKGVYIYHAYDPGYYPQGQDIECADGLWDWSFAGFEHPDWSGSQNVANIVRSSLPTNILNDYNPVYNEGQSTYTLYADGQSARIDNGLIWFSLGKKHASLGQLGTDKLYTNTPEWWTSRELWGDRWDAWNLGYNEIFSPYSNPNTKNFNNSNSGIFIYYTGLNGNDASFKIYKAGEGGYTEDEILELTPPSKPQILHIEQHWNGTHCNPKIVWRQNMEPDMIMSDEIPDKQDESNSWKRYKIYKSGNLNGMSYLPQDQQFYPEQKYQHVATIDVSPSSTDASWVDPNVVLYYCEQTGQEPGTPYPVRYRVQAVDKYNLSSVLSDYKYTVGANDGGGVEDPGGIDNVLNIENESEIPTEYSLKQNYPNPFNPTTNIQFDLPQNNFVTLKIYDVMGREIATLVNEFKNAGKYIASFNAVNLSSGIYFYKVMAGSFVETKRMVLIK